MGVGKKTGLKTQGRTLFIQEYEGNGLAVDKKKKKFIYMYA